MPKIFLKKKLGSSFLNFWGTMLLGIIPYFSIFLGGCSSIPNTLAGLATPQSTISGSNYVFFVDPDSRQLFTELPPQWNANLIRSGDNFVISLESGFLRYLQAVDPYVIIYCEAWMGPQPKPLDSESIHRQVVLIKDGLAPNSNLPLSSIPLLGPVTLGEGYHNVHVSLKVVVLSKRDNAQTVQLLNGVEGIVSTAAPVYGPAAGAAAEIGAAIVAQNRDKIEFEHSFTFTPFDLNLLTSPYESRLILRESQIVVIKGEHESRLVPYPHWGYYLWPLNWFGTYTDYYSRRYESEAYPNAPLIWHIVRLPAFLLKELFIPTDMNYFRKIATFPTKLEVEGQFLFCQNRRTPERSLKYIKYIFDGPDKNCPHSSPYSEKTFMILSIKKTEGSFGSFQEIVNGFSEHASIINRITTTSSDSKEHLTTKIDKAFERVKESIAFKLAKMKIREEAKNGVIDISDQIPFLNRIHDQEIKNESRKFLLNLKVQENIYHTTERFLAYAKSLINPKLYQLNSNDSTEMSEVRKEKLEEELIKFFHKEMIPYIKASTWKIKEDTPDKLLWLNGWKTVIENVKRKIFELGGEAVRKGFNPKEWKDLVPELAPDQT